MSNRWASWILRSRRRKRLTAFSPRLPQVLDCSTALLRRSHIGSESSTGLRVQCAWTSWTGWTGWTQMDKILKFLPEAPLWDLRTCLFCSLRWRRIHAIWAGAKPTILPVAMCQKWPATSGAQVGMWARDSKPERQQKRRAHRTRSPRPSQLMVRTDLPQLSLTTVGQNLHLLRIPATFVTKIAKQFWPRWSRAKLPTLKAEVSGPSAFQQLAQDRCPTEPVQSEHFVHYYSQKLFRDILWNASCEAEGWVQLNCHLFSGQNWSCTWCPFGVHVTSWPCDRELLGCIWEHCQAHCGVSTNSAW